ncbi:hypothetical protein [Streptomyces diastatochromogenes]|uniref:hypothetical protein n=1 Tax=Streptomyces diastatochromogenes TaxID=42236 RepID=UPI0036CDB765
MSTKHRDDQARRASRDVPDKVRLGDRPVRRMAFGAMRLAGPRIWGPPADRDHSIRLARRAVELGVDHVVTADAEHTIVLREVRLTATVQYRNTALHSPSRG